MIQTNLANMKLLILPVLVCLVCAEIQLSTRKTTKGINTTCHPGRPVVNIFRHWNICLSDSECVHERHPFAGVRLMMSEGLDIMLILHPVKTSDETFIATLMHGNISSINTSAGNISVSCGVQLSGGLNWSHPVQVSLQFAGGQPNENTTVPSKPGPTHNPGNTSGPSKSDGITAIPTKYVMFMFIAMTVVLMWGLN